MVRPSALFSLSALLAVAVVFALAVQASASAGPVSAEECKDGGWRTFPDASFKNQGDCLSAVVPGHGPSPAVTTTAPTAAPAADEAVPAPADAAVAPETVRPVAGRTAVGEVRSGTVKIKRAGSYTPLADGAVPLGATIDATDGAVALETAVAGGVTQTATFWGGEFTLAQSASGGAVVIRMPAVSTAACGPTASAASVKGRGGKDKTIRSLWVQDDHGKFRTQGRNSVATVRGTTWVTRERCDGTFTFVRDGAVSVRNRRTGAATLVRAGRGYLAR